jgi:hypothetical protein
MKNSFTEDSARQVTEEPKTKVSVAGPVRENNTAQTRSGRSVRKPTRYE